MIWICLDTSVFVWTHLDSTRRIPGNPFGHLWMKKDQFGQLFKPSKRRNLLNYNIIQTKSNTIWTFGRFLKKHPDFFTKIIIRNKYIYK